MPERILAGRTVLVTGATGGLGSATALSCAARGATVVLLGRSIPKLQAVYDALAAAGGPEPAIYPMDLAGATEDDYRELAAVVEREFGALHGLVHCAAEPGTLGPVADLSGADWQRLLHVNLTVPFVLTRELLPRLRAGRGAVVFVGDSAVGPGKAYWGAYGVAKIGLEGYARILAEENAGKLPVHFHIPGPMNSPIRRRAYPGENPATLPPPDGERIADLLGPSRRDAAI
jgi:NAD(P)-dependent dehydrogenase (short-subunit alcohol dehydrogenase family)